ncbi:hypothetical protein DMB66_24435 [Actinoplanes sp. ATCC 53533]|nr:hypothetical protein DMB66_24435 [Actinoplanes sp. ATCC 53533]
MHRVAAGRWRSPRSGGRVEPSVAWRGRTFLDERRGPGIEAGHRCVFEVIGIPLENVIGTCSDLLGTSSCTFSAPPLAPSRHLLLHLLLHLLGTEQATWTLAAVGERQLVGAHRAG